MIQRTLLRLAALEALRPSALLAANDPQFPTLAGRYVYDSRIDPLNDLAKDAARESISVYTEGHDRDKIAQSGPVFYGEQVELVFEIAISTRLVDEGAEYIALLATDSGIEGRLDLLEWQISQLLHFRPEGGIFRRMAKLPVLQWKSDPDRSGEEKIRKSARTLRVTVALKEVCEQPAPAAPLTGLDRLPAPLNEIAQALSGSAYAADLVAALAADAPVMPVATPLESVGMQVNLSDPPAEMPDDFTPHVEFSADALGD